jgi:hypothetical protein
MADAEQNVPNFDAQTTQPTQPATPTPAQNDNYQDQVTKLQKAGFSDSDIQNYSVNQAIKLRQAGFSQDEVDGYQGMQKPAQPGGTPIYGRIPTDKDFQNAASVILQGNDHPFYEKAVNSLKDMFSQSGVPPEDAVKIAQSVPSFSQIMQGNPSSPSLGDYGYQFHRELDTAIAQGEQGLAAIKSYANPNDPGVPFSERGTNPETSQMYQRGAALQKWVNDKLPENTKLVQDNPIKMGIAGGFGSLLPLVATGGVGAALTGAGSSYQEAKEAGANPEKASAQAAKMGAVWGVLGVADVGAFLKPIERSAPGVIPWITAKAAQAVRTGTVFAGTNELGDWLSSEIGKASDIPIEYKPTLQRVVVNALTGAILGPLAPTDVKGSQKPITSGSEENVKSSSEPPTEPPAPPSAAGAKLTPAYHFDSDTYGLKDDKGNFVQTGFANEAEATSAAKQSPQESVTEAAKVAPEVVDKYKKTVQQEAEKLGFNLTPEQLEQAAKVIAEQHNPPNVEKPRTLKEVESRVPNKTPVFQQPKPVEVSPRPVQLTELPKLPRELAGAKSGYKNATPQFASDVDKALYIVRDKSSGKSASHDKYVDFLKNKAGLSDAEIQKGSEDVLAAVKQNAEGKKGKVLIPHVYGADKNITINVPKKRTLAPMKSPMNALQLATSLGGIRDESGELKAMDADKHFGYGGRLVRNTGMSLDEFGQKLHDRGYVNERPTKAETLEINRNGLNGKHTYAEEDRAKLEAKDEKGQQSAYHEDLERHADEMGIDTTGMKTEEIRAALELQNKEAAAEHNFLDKVESYKIGEQEHANETIPLSAYEDGERGGAKSNAGQQPDARTEASRSRATADESGVSGRRTSADESEPFHTGEPSFESVKGVEGEQAVMPSMEKSAKQAMAARGDKITPKAEQRPADEGLFADKEDRGDFLFQKGDGILSHAPNLDAFTKDLSDYLQKTLPKGYEFDLTKNIIKDENGQEAYGLTDRLRKLVLASLRSPDLRETIPHEIFHANFGLITDKEWTILHNEAVKQNLRDHYQIDKNYDSNQEEETVAHWYGDWQKKRIGASQEANSIFQKIKNILDTIALKIRSAFGNETAEDIFKKLERGEITKRENDSSDNQTLFQKAKDATLGEAIKGIRDTFSPTSAGNGAKNTEVAIRGAYGQAKRDRAISETALNEFARQANAMTPDEHSDFYNYVEGRSNGAQLKNKQFQKMADTIRKVYQDWRDKLQAMPETRMMNFVTDYFTHQWAKGQDEEIKEFMNSWWQQGSGKNLKERKIPTIADGLAYGLQLEEPNPVRAVSRYVGSMSNYIASVKVLRAINTELGGAFYADGMQPKGYMPLVGRNAERIENATIDQESGRLIPARNLKLYAPREVADLYNAFYSKGFEDTKLGSAYMVARNAINLNTMFELGLSAYHFSTINMQSFNQDMSRIMRNAFAGDWQGVGAALKGLVTPGLHFMQGQKLMDQYKDLADHGVDMETIANLFARSNMRLGLDPLANVSSHGGFYTAWQRGELPALMDKLKSQITQNYGIGALKSGAEVLQRAVSDIAHPLFSVYVPAIKMSAFHDLMGDWLRQHSDASDGEISVNALRIGNMVEDRFGEMNMENIFWNQKAKELLGLTFRAPGWDIGLVRQVGGAGLDVFNMLKNATKGKFDPNKLDRPMFIAAAVVNYIALNAAMTYIKTGKQPSDQTYKDWIAYATGGMHKAFGMHPEQAELPGHGRELLQMAPVPGEGPLSGVEQETENKIATLPKKVYQDFTNKDWNGKPVYDPKSKSWVQSTPGVAQAAHLASGFVPFQMEQLFEGQAPSSNLSFAERFLGVRAAGAKIVAPEALKEYNERHN